MFSFHFRENSIQVKTAIYKEVSKSNPQIDLNNYDLEVKEKDITLDENYQEIHVNDPCQLLFHTTKELISHVNDHSSNENYEIVKKVTEEFVERYGALEKHQKNIVLINIATSHYIKEDVLKIKVASIQGSESLMKSESDIRKILDPSYDWIFECILKIQENGCVFLEDLQKHLLNMFENIPFLSHYQKMALKVMRDHLLKYVNQKTYAKEQPETPQPCTE